MDVTSGGYSSGYRLTVDYDPEMDGDRYRSELCAWSKERREREGEVL